MGLYLVGGLCGIGGSLGSTGSNYPTNKNKQKGSTGCCRLGPMLYQPRLSQQPRMLCRGPSASVLSSQSSDSRPYIAFPQWPSLAYVICIRWLGIQGQIPMVGVWLGGEPAGAGIYRHAELFS